jgi:hypothetical protein
LGIPTTRRRKRGAHPVLMDAQHVIRVTLEAPSGELWDAIGGGESVDAALEFAVASAPAETHWRILAWREIYGD